MVEDAKRVLKRKTLIQKVIAKIFIYSILLIMYAPILYLVVFSFTSSKVIGTWSGFSFDNFILLFNPKNGNSQDIWKAVFNTLLIAVSAGLCSTVLGTTGAIGMYYSKKKARNFLDFMTQIPVVNAEIVIAISLTILFVSIHQKMSFVTLLVGHVVLTVPFVVLSVIPKLQQMDPNLYEAALDLGANQTQALFKVVIPEVVPGILSGFMLSVTLSLDDYIITAFTKPVLNFETISTYVDKITKKSGLPPQFRAFTTLMFLMIVLIIVGMNIYSHRQNKKQIKED